VGVHSLVGWLVLVDHCIGHTFASAWWVNKAYIPMVVGDRGCTSLDRQSMPILKSNWQSLVHGPKL